MADVVESFCLNCDAAVGEARFCGACGQERRVARLRIVQLIQEFSSGLFDLDRPWARTLRGLVPEAGRFSREYVRGRRVGVVGPLRFLLVALAVQVAANEVLRLLLAHEQSPVPRWMPLLLLALGPALAFLLRIVCNARHYDLAEMMVPVFYAMGMVSLLLVPMRMVELLLPVQWQITTVLVVLLAGVPAYLAFTLVRFVPCGWLRAGFATYLCGGVATIIVGSLLR
jgi:hypothetical protein